MVHRPGKAQPLVRMIGSSLVPPRGWLFETPTTGFEEWTQATLVNKQFPKKWGKRNASILTFHSPWAWGKLLIDASSLHPSGFVCYKCGTHSLGSNPSSHMREVGVFKQPFVNPSGSKQFSHDLFQKFEFFCVRIFLLSGKRWTRTIYCQLRSTLKTKRWPKWMNIAPIFLNQKDRYF